MKKLLLAISCSSALLVPATANAYLIFFGEDLNNSATVPLSSTPGSDGAFNTGRRNFQSNLTNARTEDFEGIAAGTTSVSLNFPRGTTATFSGGSGIARTQSTGTASQGQYSAPSPTSTGYWEARLGEQAPFSINFNQAISALGFYAIDVGDDGGQLQIQLSDNTGILDTLTVPNTEGSGGSTDGSALFYGIIAESPAEEFTDVTFLTTLPAGPDTGIDTIALDLLTIEPADQIIPPQNPIPSPATLALFGLGLAGLGWSKRKV